MPTFAFVVTPSDVIRLVIAAAVVVGIIGWYAYHYVLHILCKHEDVFENGHCHAICRRCRKDLGFIGKWREKINQTEQTDRSQNV